jgi:hypothetical protein
MTMKRCLTGALGALGALLACAAGAAGFTVQAAANSSAGGTGLPSVALVAGQSFTVAVNPGDLWSAGPLPRWSNADGLVGDLYATGFDESGLAFGTRIGADFGTWTQDGFAAPYGALVGRLGDQWLLLGTRFDGIAPATGVLDLYYWDTDSANNDGAVLASITAGAVPAVPEPASAAMLGAGLALVALRARARRRP